MSHHANVKPDQLGRGVAIHLWTEAGGGFVSAVTFGETRSRMIPPEDEPPRDSALNLREEYARALYEALAQHFGHTGHDMRALRKDYDAERQRVDKFIAHLTKD